LRPSTTAKCAARRCEQNQFMKTHRLFPLFITRRLWLALTLTIGALTSLMVLRLPALHLFRLAHQSKADMQIVA